MWRWLRRFRGAGGEVPGTSPHDWRECRPVIVKVGLREGTVPGPEAGDDLRAAVLGMVWSRLRPADKQAFHRFGCLNSKDPEDVAVAQQISATLRAEMRRRGI
jgi:hypothetical protein